MLGIYQTKSQLSTDPEVMLESKDPPPAPGDSWAFADHDVFLARYRDDKLEKVVRIGGARDQIGYEAAVDSEENTVIVGTLTGAFELDGAPVMEPKRFLHVAGFILGLDPADRSSFVSTTSGLTYAAGYTAVEATKTATWVGGFESDTLRTRAVVLRLDRDGKERLRWSPQHRLGMSYLNDVVASPTGGVVILGTYSGPFQIDGRDVLPAKPDVVLAGFAVALNDDGTISWAKELGALDPQHGVFTADGRLWITSLLFEDATLAGQRPRADNGAGAVITLDEDHRVKLVFQMTGRPSGTKASSVYYKAASFFYEAWPNGALIASDPWGNLVIATGFSADLRLGPEKIAGSGARDTVVFRLDPQGKLLGKRLLDGPGQLPHALAVDASGDAWVGGLYVDKADGLLTRVAP